MYDRINKTTWEQYENGWYQKTYLDENGTPIHSYHYLRKETKPSITIQIKTSLSLKYNAYILIEKDLRDTLSFIEILSKLFNNEGKANDLIMKALSRAIVITYGKCFTRADGRRVKLEKKYLPKNFLEVHDELMTMRHNYVAHAGTSDHEVCCGVVALPPRNHNKSQPTAYFSEVRQTILSDTLIDKITKRLIENRLQYTKDKISEIGVDLRDKLDQLDLDKIYIESELNQNNNFIIDNTNFINYTLK